MRQEVCLTDQESNRISGIALIASGGLMTVLVMHCFHPGKRDAATAPRPFKPTAAVVGVVNPIPHGHGQGYGMNIDWGGTRPIESYAVPGKPNTALVPSGLPGKADYTLAWMIMEDFSRVYKVHVASENYHVVEQPGTWGVEITYDPPPAAPPTSVADINTP